MANIVEAAQRLGIQLPRAHCTEWPQKPNDLAREAVSCNAGLGRNAGMVAALHGDMHALLDIGPSFVQHPLVPYVSTKPTEAMHNRFAKLFIPFQRAINCQALLAGRRDDVGICWSARSSVDMYNNIINRMLG